MHPDFELNEAFGGWFRLADFPIVMDALLWCWNGSRAEIARHHGGVWTNVRTNEPVEPPPSHFAFICYPRPPIEQGALAIQPLPDNSLQLGCKQVIHDLSEQLKVWLRPQVVLTDANRRDDDVEQRADVLPTGEHPMTETATPKMTREELVNRLVEVMRDGAKAGVSDTLGAAWCAMQIVGGHYAAETVARYCSLTSDMS